MISATFLGFPWSPENILCILGAGRVLGHGLTWGHVRGRCLGLGADNTATGMQEPPAIYCFPHPSRDTSAISLLCIYPASDKGSPLFQEKLFLSEEKPVSCSHMFFMYVEAFLYHSLGSRNWARGGIRKTRSLPYGAQLLEGLSYN